MNFIYKLKSHIVGKVSTVSIDFTPYTNLIGAWNGSTTGWASDNSSVVVTLDAKRKLFDKSSLLFKVKDGLQEGTIRKNFTCTPNTYYMASAYVRNNGVLTTGLRVGSSNDWSSNYYANRLICVFNSGANTSMSLNLDMFYQSDLVMDAWGNGFFLTEISEADSQLSLEELSQKYPYIEGTKDSPSMRDVIASKYHGSPFEYFLTMDGIRITNYSFPLSYYGVTSDTLLESHINDLPAQVFYTFINSVALMAMLEGDITRVSHTYPKMPSDLDGTLTIFPRVQYFMGFEVSSARADNKPLANNVTLTINIYVPITKTLNSMQDDMLSQIVTSLMGELNFSAIRGSDFFREPEQLYVRQTQYIKDVQIVKKVKA